jgi:hypothetical protein
MKRWPFHWPDSRAYGARPAKLGLPNWLLAWPPACLFICHIILKRLTYRQTWKCSRFRHFHQQSGSGDGAHAGDGRDDLERAFCGLVADDEVSHGRIDGFQIQLDLAQPAFVLGHEKSGIQGN